MPSRWHIGEGRGSSYEAVIADSASVIQSRDIHPPGGGRPCQPNAAVAPTTHDIECLEVTQWPLGASELVPF